MTDNLPPLQREREAFEAWFRENYHDRLDRNMLDKSYNSPAAFSTWRAWKARAAIDAALAARGAVPAGWVPLTDDDRRAAFESLPDMLDGFLKTWGWLHFANAIENRCREKNAAAPQQVAQPSEPFQPRVKPWLLACFGEMIAGDKVERNHRFLEEALELVQACGCTEDEARQLVGYVYGRPVGEPSQEVGGVMVTLAALCLARGIDMHSSAETELARIWTKVEQIRAKQAAKPKHSPLPTVTQAKPEQAAQQWMPIETAPKDGRILMGRVGYSWVFSASWDEHRAHWSTGTGSMEFFANPTHWMPLPAAPQKPKD